MEDRDDSSRLGRVDVLDGVPGAATVSRVLYSEGADLRCSRTTLGLAISNKAGNNQVWVIHNCTERDSQRVTQLTTLVDGSWGFGVDVTGQVSLSVTETRHCLTWGSHQELRTR